MSFSSLLGREKKALEKKPRRLEICVCVCVYRDIFLEHYLLLRQSVETNNSQKCRRSETSFGFLFRFHPVYCRWLSRGFSSMTGKSKSDLTYERLVGENQISSLCCIYTRRERKRERERRKTTPIDIDEVQEENKMSFFISIK